MIGGAVNASLNHLTKTLSKQGKLDKVSVSIINPGMTLTGRLKALLKADAKVLKKYKPYSKTKVQGCRN